MASSSTLLRGLLLGQLAVVLALSLWRQAPPSPLPADAPPERFSAVRARAVAERLSAGLGPHPVGSPDNARLRERLLSELRALGFAPPALAVQSRTQCWRRGRCDLIANVLAGLPGRVGPPGEAPTVLIAAHYDSASTGPGASDDLSGVAALLETARALRAGAAPHNPVLFAFTDAEEAGLLGAKLLLAAPTPATADAPSRPALARRLAVAVNLDARGTSGRSLLFETGAGNLELLRLYQKVVAHPAASSVFFAIYKKMPNDTDFTVFRRAGLSGFNFAFTGDVAHYHTPEDDLAHADMRSWQHQGEQALAVVRALADSDLREPPPAGRASQDAVYFDLLGAALVLWPLSLTLPLAVLAAALLCACALIVRRSPRWRGHDLASVDRWLWLYGPWALLALLLAALLPEVSYPLLLPALLAGVAGLLYALRPRDGTFALLHLLPALGADLLLVPLLLQLCETLNTPPLLLAAGVGAALLAGLPLLPLRRPRQSTHASPEER